MGKNIEMLKTYHKVLKGNQEEINSIIPNMYAKSFYDIDYDYLKELKIDNLIIDVDNTILPPDDINVPIELINKIEELKNKGFNICLVSNNFKKRLEPVGNILKVKYLYEAKKPYIECFERALVSLETKDKNKTAMIGDQMLTDIKGSKNYGIYSILVRPISKHNNIGTYVNRKLQNRIEKYLKRKNRFDKDVYYKNR